MGGYLSEIQEFTNFEQEHITDIKEPTKLGVIAFETIFLAVAGIVLYDLSQIVYLVGKTVYESHILGH